MAVIENLDIVLGAKTQQADNALRHSVQEVQSVTQEIGSLSATMAAFEPVSLAVTAGIGDFLATIPGVSAGIQAFQTTASILNAIFAARQAAGAKQIVTTVQEIQKESRAAVQVIQGMERAFDRAADAAEDIVDVPWRNIPNAPRLGSSGGLIPRPMAPTGIGQRFAGELIGRDDAVIQSDIEARVIQTKALGEAARQTGQASGAASLIGRVGMASVAVGVGVAVAAVAGLAVAWKNVAEQSAAVDELADSASKLGMSVSDLSTMRLSLGETSGLDDGAIDNAIQKMTVGLSDAAAKKSGPLHDRLASIGLEAGQLLEMGPVKAMEALMVATEGMKSPTDQLMLAYDVFGKQGAALVSSLREGPDALREMGAWAQKTGVSISDAQAEQMGAANDAWGHLEMVATGVWRQIAVESAPVLQVIYENISAGLSSFSGYLEYLPAIVDGAVYFAGQLYDVVELSQVLHTTLHNIVTLNWSEVGADIQSAFTFDTGQKNLEAVQAARDAAAAAARQKKASQTNQESAFAQYEEEKRAAAEAAKEIAARAQEAETAQRRADEERERAAGQAAATIRKRLDSIHQEIALQRELGQLTATQASEREQEIRDRMSLHAELREQGVTDFAEIDYLTNQAIALRKANEEREQLSDRAKDLTKQFDSSIQLRETMRELNQLRERGLISSTVFDKAARDAGKSENDRKGAVSVQADSVEAYRLLLDKDNENRADQKAIRRATEAMASTMREMKNDRQSPQVFALAR